MVVFDTEWLVTKTRCELGAAVVTDGIQQAKLNPWMVEIKKLYQPEIRLVLGCIEAKFCKLQGNSKYSLESSRRDPHSALLCTVFGIQIRKAGKKNVAKTTLEKLKIRSG